MAAHRGNWCHTGIQRLGCIYNCLVVGISGSILSVKGLKLPTRATTFPPAASGTMAVFRGDAHLSYFSPANRRNMFLTVAFLIHSWQWIFFFFQVKWALLEAVGGQLWKCSNALLCITINREPSQILMWIPGYFLPNYKSVLGWDPGTHYFLKFPWWFQRAAKFENR